MTTNDQQRTAANPFHSVIDGGLQQWHLVALYGNCTLSRTVQKPIPDYADYGGVHCAERDPKRISGLYSIKGLVS